MNSQKKSQNGHKISEWEHLDLGDTMGSATGAEEHATLAGGWSGTDDAASTAPSDQLGNPPLAEGERPPHEIARDLDHSVQGDEEQQFQRAQEADEAVDEADRAEVAAKRARWHQLAERVRAVRHR